MNEEAGTTRDRQYGKSEWLGREFSVVDTGGWVVNSDDIFEEEIRKQVLLAVEEADVILFVVDVMNGVTDLDMQVATIFYFSDQCPVCFSGVHLRTGSTVNGQCGNAAIL
nr:GTPase [Bacteroides thetaiotaomicron]